MTIGVYLFFSSRKDSPVAIDVKKLDNKTKITPIFLVLANSYTNKKASVTKNNVIDKTNKIYLIFFLKNKFMSCYLILKKIT